MKVYPKNQDDSSTNTFAQARHKKYNRKVEDNAAFDAQIESAGLAQAVDPVTADVEDYADFGGSMFQEELDSFTAPEKVALLRRYYNPVKYRGTIFPVFGGKPYTLDSIQCKRENNLVVVQSGGESIYDRKRDGYVTLPTGAKHQVQKARPFNLNSALQKHISKRDNLGIYFYQDKCKMIAFDIDSETGVVDASTESSLNLMILSVSFLELTPFVYHSGGKGFHLEVFFDKHISVNRLNTLNQIILNKYHERGGRHIDCVYPSGKAFRIFGCNHYKTGCFTNAIKYNVEITVNPTTNKRSGRVEWVELTPAESWELFSKTPFNDSTLVDKIIADNPALAKRNLKSKKGTANGDYAPKTHFYDIDILRRIYQSGLFLPYTRYNTAFQLGRYFKHQLKLTEDEAKKEINTWLKRHYAEQCPNGLTPFEGANIGIIKTPYALCEVETLMNCLNGFHLGKPFKRERVNIDYPCAYDYLRGLKYSRKKEAALLTLLSYAQEFNSLTMGFSYEQLLRLFHVKSKSTVSAWLKEFMTDYVFVCTKKGDYKTRKTSQYRLMLPEDLYTVIENK